MKIKELIEELKKHDENMEVCIGYVELDLLLSRLRTIEYDSVSIVEKKDDIYCDSEGNEHNTSFVSLMI